MLWVPESQWNWLLDAFASTPDGLERVAYLEGLTWEDRSGAKHGVVTSVTIPNATLRPGNYAVTGAAVAQAAGPLFEHGLKRLAQVHTHGNDWTNHSDTDDRRAYSASPGALSIVLPYHARRSPIPADGGIHIRTVDGWERADDPHRIVRIVPSSFDHRPTVTNQKRRRWWQWSR